MSGIKYNSGVSDYKGTPYEISDNYLNIGNIVDLVDKLTIYRQIIFKNLLNKNSFSIHLNRG
jgi:hypothetical protein